jgi:two-component sensor histidine kinase
LLHKSAQINLELERRVQEKDLMLSEIHHRVKNSLQVVSSLLNLEAGRIHDPAVHAMLQMTQNRIRSMALIHQTLYQSKDFAEVDFHAFLQSFVPTLIQSYSIFPEQIALSFRVAEVQLPIDAAIPCGLIVNELISNALKHAFPKGRAGKIDIEFVRLADGHLSLSVRDDGVGLPSGFRFENSETLGVQLVTMLAGQLHGAVTIDSRGGTGFEVRFPLRVA